MVQACNLAEHSCDGAAETTQTAQSKAVEAEQEFRPLAHHDAEGTVRCKCHSSHMWRRRESGSQQVDCFSLFATSHCCVLMIADKIAYYTKGQQTA
jgi:hypothetical protein